MRTRALVLSLVLVGCSNTVTSPAIESTVHPLPLADAGGLVEPDGSGAASASSPATDAGPAPAEDAGSPTTPERDAAPGAPDASELPDAAPAADAAPAITCREAPLQDNVCKDYGMVHSLMYFCTDGDAGPAACPSPYVLIQYNATGTDYTSQCCTPS